MAQLNDLLVMGQSSLLGPTTINSRLTVNDSIFVSNSINLINGADLVLRGSNAGTASDSGDLIFADANGTENARIWWDQTNQQLLHRIASGSQYRIYHTGNLQFSLSGTTLTITIP